MRVDFHLLAMVVLLAALHMSNGHAAAPLHDSMQAYQVFHYVYNTLFWHGQVPHWMPTSAYGLDMDLWNFWITPAGWVTAFAGARLGIRDILLMFKVSVFLEHLILLVGTYALSRRIYTHPAAVWFVCLGVIGSVLLYYQIWFSFRIFYFLPLIFFLIVRWTDTAHPAFLWTAALSGVVMCIGNLGYFPPFLLMVVGAFFLAMLVPQFGSLKRFVAEPKRHLPYFLLFAAAALAFVYIGLHIGEEKLIIAAGRDAATGLVKHDDFLVYGGHPTLPELLQMICTGVPAYGKWSGPADQTVFTGMMVLPLAVAAIYFCRSRVFLAIAITGAVVFLFAAGGIFTWLAYYLPMMSRYRHVGLTYDCFKLLLLLCAGFGVDQLIPRLRAVHLAVAGVVVICIADMQLQVSGWVRSLRTLVEALDVRLMRRELMLGVFGVVALLIAAGMRGKRSQQVSRVGIVLLLVCHGMDLLTWNRNATLAESLSLQDVIVDVFHVRQMKYEPRRTAEPSGVSQLAGAQVVDRLRERGAVYQVSSALVGHDPCKPPTQVQLANAHVAKVHRARSISPTQTKALFRCGREKLRIVQNVTRVPESSEVSFLASMDPDAVIVADADAPLPTSVQPTSPAGTARVTGYQPNSLDAEISVASEGGWLVYLDAYHSDWTATIDGQPAKVWRANGCFKALQVPAGNHAVRFSFRGDRTITGTGVLAILASGWFVGFALWTMCLLFFSATVRDRVTPG